VACGSLLYGPPPYSDPDAYWHLAAGQEILQQGAIPYTDPWSFAADQRWYNLAWLFDTGLALMHSFGGETLLMLLPAVSLGLLLATTYWLLPLWGVHSPTPRLAATLLSASILIPCGTLRPHLASLWLVVLTLALLQQSREHKKQLLWLLPITVLWVNTHGSFLLLAPLLGAHLLESLIEKNKTRLQDLTLIGLGASACTFVNPLGWHLYQGALRTLRSNITPYISEWMAWTVDPTGAFGSLSILFVLALVGAALLRPTNPPPLAERLLLFLFLSLSLFSIRFFLFLAMISCPFIALQIGNRKKDPLSTQIGKYILCAMLWITFAPCLYAQKTIYDRLWIKTLPQQLDREAVHTLIAQRPNARVFSSYGTAGPLTLYGSLPKKLQHYLDGRVGTAFSEPTLQEYIDTFQRKKPLQEILGKYQINAALLENDLETPFEEDLLKLGWKKSHENMKYRIYLCPHACRNPENP
jgi:hypothetical protein